MNRFVPLPFVIALLTSMACGSTSSSTSVGPTPTRCAVAATPSPAAFPPAGGSGNLVVSAARECSWSASTQATWISLARPAEGQGDGAVKYTVAPNPQAVSRRGTLVVGGETAEVTQQPATCRFELSRRSIELGSAAQTADLNVEAPGGCAWSARSSTSWITIVEGGEGNGNGRVRFRVGANTGNAARSGSLEVAGQRVDVRQLSGAGTPPPPTPGDCSYDVVPSSAEASADQTDGSVAVQTDAGCSWTAESNAAWLTIVAGASGNGPGQVDYRAAANSSTSSRTAEITVNGAVFTLQQAGSTSFCSYDISPSSDSVSAEGDTGQIDVDAGPLCAWSASTEASWIEITSGSANIGNGRVEYRVDPNASTSARTGIIDVAGHQFTIDQEAGASPQPVTITGSVRDDEGSCPDKRFRVDGQNIRTTSATDYEDGDCDDIQRNEFVRVTGMVGSDAVLTADEVEF